jgi:Domain of unknown function (DUF6431)
VETCPPVSMVWPWPLDVDAYVECGQQIEAPRPACPGCAGTMQCWYGSHRHLREDRDRLIRIPRVRCRECGRTQALLPLFVLPSRWDTMEWIGRGIELAAAGWGLSPYRCFVGRPESIVRDGLRRVRRGADELCRQLLARATSWGWSGWELPQPGLRRLWAAVKALAEQWRRRRGPASATRGPWWVRSCRVKARPLRKRLTCFRGSAASFELKYLVCSRSGTLRALEVSDLRACRIYEFSVAVGVPSESPPAFNRLRE